jgi:hypothetical protein
VDWRTRGRSLCCVTDWGISPSRERFTAVAWSSVISLKCGAGPRGILRCMDKSVLGGPADESIVGRKVDTWHTHAISPVILYRKTELLCFSEYANAQQRSIFRALAFGSKIQLWSIRCR